jgi:hypothetical protein
MTNDKLLYGIYDFKHNCLIKEKTRIRLDNFLLEGVGPVLTGSMSREVLQEHFLERLKQIL